jgi:thiol-disulfide isomerase/thioredoxin
MICISCNEPTIESYETRVAACLDNSPTIEFVIDGSEEKAFSHNVPIDCALGSRLTDFEVDDINGNLFSSESLKGKINVINFWFIKCKPCIKEMPKLSFLKGKYRSVGINFIAVGLDSKEQIIDFLKNNSFDYKIIPGGERLTKKKYKMFWGYPLTIVSDRENIIVGVFKSVDDEKVYQELDDLLSSLN